MKSPIAVAILTFLLFACATEKTEKIFDFKCETPNTTFLTNIQYDRRQNKFRIISAEDETGNIERIIGKEYNAFEKKDEVLIKITKDESRGGGDAFLNLKSGKLKIVNIEDGKEAKEILNCKRI